MSTPMGHWGVSTDRGVTLGADELVDLLTTHHDRVLSAWERLSAEQWNHASRNARWSVHDTARHVADAMELSAARQLGAPSRFDTDGFDPLTTPDEWLAQSADDSPARTMQRYANAAAVLRDRVGERMAAGDVSMGSTVYGPAHWTVSVVHVFWDSWLHERDMLVPLGLDAATSAQEQVLAGLYGLLMAILPARMMDQPFDVTVRFTGEPSMLVTAGHRDGQLISAVAASGAVGTEPTVPAGELTSVVDAMSGRGARLDAVLPGAPALLGVLAAHFSA